MTTLLDSIKATHFRWVIVFLLFFILLFNFVDRSATAFILENIQNDYQLSDTQLGLIMGSFSIGFLITAFLGGICLDKYGPKIILLVMVLMWAISMFSMAAAAGFLLLFLARVLLGLAEGPTFPALTMVIGKWLPVKERASALGFTQTAAPIGIAISGPIVALLIYYFSWRGMFVVLGAIALIWIPFWLYFFKNSPKDSKHVSNEELNHINNINNQAQASKGEETQAIDLTKSKLIASILSNGTVLANIFAYSVFCFFFYFFLSWLPSYLARSYEVSILAQGGATVIIWGLATVFMFFSGPLFDFIYRKTGSCRYARSYPIIVAQLVPAFCILIIFLSGKNMPMGVAIALIAVAVSFVMLGAPTYYAVTLDVVKKGTGFALGVLEASTSVAGFLAPVVTGYIVDTTKSFNAAFIFLIVLGVAAAVVVWFFHRPDNCVSLK